MTCHRRESGAALIVVLSALLMLLVIATPFVLSSKKDYRNAVASSERFRARAIADAALDHARLELARTHAGVEAVGGGHGTVLWDTPGELQVDAFPASWRALSGEPGEGPLLRDPRGDLWGITVRDEQSWIDARSAPPFVWAALLGRTTTAEVFDGSSKKLLVASTAGFPAGGGELIVGDQTVTYTQATDGAFLLGGALRGPIEAGTWVLSGAARSMALFEHRSPRAQSGATALAMPSMVKEVAEVGGRVLSEPELDRVMAPLTVWGRRHVVSGWLEPVPVVRRDVDPKDFAADGDGQPVSVSDATYFNPGTVVRLAGPNGQPVHHDVVRRVTEGTVWLVEPAPTIFPWGVSTLTAEARQPVNVNGCSREVLVLLLEGLEHSANVAKSDPAQRVSRELAEEIADVMLKNRPIRGIDHLIELLKALHHLKRGQGGEYGGYASLEARDLLGVGVAPLEVEIADVQTDRGRGGADFTVEMALAIVQNALNANHRSLLSSTMPFAFTSGDVFTVEAAASTNDAAGNELARHRQRETFRSAPSRLLELRLDTQADFEQPIVAGRSGRWIDTHPRAVARFRGPTAKPEPRITRMMANFEVPSRPSIFPSREDGEVRLQTARDEVVVPVNLEEHFDGDLAGAVAVGSPTRNTGIRSEWISPEGFQIDAARRYEGILADTGANLADDRGLHPLVIELWVKPASFGNEQTFLWLGGADPEYDFVRLLWQPSDRTLRLQVHDNTVDGGAAPGGFREMAEAVWTPPATLEDDTWYHLAAHVGGTRPHQVSLHVDGWKRGESQFASRLSGPFSPSDTTFEVEDSEGWPDEGVFWVGLELVEASRSGPNSWRVLQNPRPAPQIGTDGDGNAINDQVWPDGRGARNTRIDPHPAGESVRLFGYSLALTRADGASGEVLRGGSGRLASALAPFDITAIGDDGTTAGTIQVQGTTATGMPVPGIPIRILDLNGVSRIQLDSFGQPGELQREHEAFQESGGYALIVGIDPTTVLTEGQPLEEANMIAQVLRYERRQNDELRGLHPVAPAVALDFGAQIDQTKIYTTSLASVATRLASGSQGTTRLAAIMPISVHLNSVEAFLDLQERGDGDRIADYVQVGAPARVPSHANLSAHDIEWIRYTAIDRLNAMLIDLDRETMADAIDAVLAGLFVEDPDEGGNKPPVGFVLDVLRFRGQAHTRQFGYDTRDGGFKVHASGREAMPTFRISNPAIHSPSLGYGDAVTLYAPVDATRLRRHVSWSYVTSVADDAGDFAFAAFTEAVPGTIRQVQFQSAAGESSDDRDLTRVLKFPSGELPLITRRGDATIGTDGQGTTAPMIIDEVIVRRLLPRHYTVWDRDALTSASQTTTATALPFGADEESESIGIADVDMVKSRYENGAPLNLALPDTFVLPDGRVVRPSASAPITGLAVIGDEVVAYRAIVTDPTVRFDDCERGYMNTTPVPHSLGVDVTILDWRGISKLTQGVTAEDWEIPVASGFLFAPNGGAALIDQEMIHWTERAGNLLRMPARVDDGDPEGLFRGRFGTQAGRHGQDAIVLDMPFRYWDRWAPESDHPDLAFYGVGLDEPRVVLDRLDWTVAMPKPNLRLVVLCRLDPDVPWDTPIAKSGGRLLLLESESGQDLNAIQSKLLGLGGRDVELRVFFTWEAGAFDAFDLRANAWKETPRLLDLSLRYFAPETVLRREVLR